MRVTVKVIPEPPWSDIVGLTPTIFQNAVQGGGPSLAERFAIPCSASRRACATRIVHKCMLDGNCVGGTASGDGLCAVATANTVATWTGFKLPVRYVANGHDPARYRAGVDVDVKIHPKMSDSERDFWETLRSRVEMSTGQRISPNNRNLSEVGGFKDKTPAKILCERVVAPGRWLRA